LHKTEISMAMVVCYVLVRKARYVTMCYVEHVLERSVTRMFRRQWMIKIMLFLHSHLTDHQSFCLFFIWCMKIK